jgi:hypothetical protein
MIWRAQFACPLILSLTDEELCAYWNLWLEQAQASNDLDQYTYSHGVFVTMTEPHAQ